MKAGNLNDEGSEKKSIDLAIKLIPLALLITWCAMILSLGYKLAGMWLNESSQKSELEPSHL